MKRTIIFILLVLIVIAGYMLINNGLENDNFSIASYSKIGVESNELTKKLANYDKKNKEDYETALITLNSYKEKYKESKVFSMS